MGLYKRVTLGFMSIVVVLILSGVVSFIELSTLSRDTNKILDVNRKDREFATELLQALHEQNSAFVEITAFDLRSKDTSCFNSIARMEKILLEGRMKSVDTIKIDSMLLLTKQIKTLTQDFVTSRDAAAFEVRQATKAQQKAASQKAAAQAESVNRNVAQQKEVSGNSGDADQSLKNKTNLSQAESQKPANQAPISQNEQIKQDSAAQVRQNQAAAKDQTLAIAKQEQEGTAQNQVSANSSNSLTAREQSEEKNRSVQSELDNLTQSKQFEALAVHNSTEFFNKYRPYYQNMLNLISQYMIASVDSLTPGAEQLHHNAYRALAPVLISLVVMIAILLMLYFFMLIVCVNPIVKINRSLMNYINFKIPFAPKCFARDELEQLCDGIDSVIGSSKK